MVKKRFYEKIKTEINETEATKAVQASRNVREGDSLRR